MSNIVDLAKKEIIKRSNAFYERTKGTKEEYNLYEEHVKYVYKYALILSKKKNVDLEIVELSALLHDIAMTDSNLDRSKHNEYGAVIAEQFLKNNNYDKDKIEMVKKCILNHNSKRKEYRTTEEENILVNADAMAHFDCVESVYSLANSVMGLNEEDSIKFVKDKLSKDYNEIDDNVKKIIKEKYQKIMNSTKLEEMIDDINHLTK